MMPLRAATKIELNSRLAREIDTWIKNRKKTWQGLFIDAKLTQGISTNIKRGANPHPTVLVKLARAMNLPVYKLFYWAEYMTETEMEDFINKSDLTPEEIQLIETYRELDPVHADIVLRVVRGFRLGDDRKLT